VTADIGADVLKVPHHGSHTNDGAFLDAVSPAVAIITVGATNPFGHPHPDTLAALEGRPVFRTDIHGRITVRTDGSAIVVGTEQ
jgi:competence protein ComEC